jgi:hypothetical protein
MPAPLPPASFEAADDSDPPPPPPPSKPASKRKPKKRKADSVASSDAEAEPAADKNGRSKRPTLRELKIMEMQRDELASALPLTEDVMAWLHAFKRETPQMLQGLQAQANTFGASSAKCLQTVREAEARMAQVAEMATRLVESSEQHMRQMEHVLDRFDNMTRRCAAANAEPMEYVFRNPPATDEMMHEGGLDLDDPDSIPLTPR